MAETHAEEIARLQREISERQNRLIFLLLGDQAQGVSLGGPFAGLPERYRPTAGRVNGIWPMPLITEDTGHD